MILLLYKNFADGFTHRKLVKRIALTHAPTVLPNRLLLVFQIEAQHVFSALGGLHWLRYYRRHTAQIVDVVGYGESMLKLFVCMNLEFRGDIHVCRAL